MHCIYWVSLNSYIDHSVSHSYYLNQTILIFNYPFCHVEYESIK